MGVTGPDREGHLVGRRVVDVVVADLGHRRRVAMPHAGRAHHPDLERIEPLAECRHQLPRPHQLAGQAVADPDRQRRRRRLALLDHVEMGVEGRDLVDLGLGEAHLLCERCQMGGREMAEAILDQVQVLDQESAPARPALEQGAHRLEGRGIDLSALGPCQAAPLATARVTVLADLASGLTHP